MFLWPLCFTSTIILKFYYFRWTRVHASRSQEYASCWMKDSNSKFPPKYSSRNLFKSAHPCFLSSVINLRCTAQQEIKSLLLKTNNKRNSAINNSVKKVMDIAIRSCIATILIFLSHTGLLNQVFDRFRKKLQRHPLLA